MTMSRLPRHLLLSIDFDGVLHPFDAHFAIDDVQAVSIDDLHAAGLFVHCQALADVLGGRPGVDLVVHSSWRLVHDLASLRRLLGPLGPRLRAVTPPQEADREMSVALLMRNWGWDPGHVLILDDQPALFPRLADRVIACDPRIGLPSALSRLQAALAHLDAKLDAIEGNPP